MKNRLAIQCAVVVCLLAVCGPLFAHHGSGVSYDLKKQVTLSGKIVEMDWKNPHVFVLFDVKDDKGNIAHWGGETHTPAQLKAIGWNKDDLKVGDQITVTLFPSRVGTSRGLIAKIVHNNKVIIDDGASRNRPEE